jgi:putative transposase
METNHERITQRKRPIDDVGNWKDRLTLTGRVSNARLLAPEVETVIEVAIGEFYLTRMRPTVSDLVREVERRCHDEQLRPPSYKAVAARLRAHDQQEVLRRRHGAAYARSKLGRLVGRLTADEPLSLVQIDYTLAGVIVVSWADRRPLVRPWLTLAIDVATRMVTGFHLGLEPPSALSVALALSHAVLPKDEYLQGRGVDLPWPVCGLPSCLHLDNAKEFRSEALARGAALYGIKLQYRPPATPHWGGHIERLIGTMMGPLRLLPGATGRSVAERGPDPEATAAMTLDELENWLVHQIVGVYHCTQHRSLGTTPITAWAETVARSSAPPRLPQDLDRFYLDFLPFRRRTIRREGLALFNIRYSDGVLSTFLRKPRQQVIVRYDPRDMSQVYLRDEDGSYCPFPSVTDGSPLSRWPRSGPHPSA